MTYRKMLVLCPTYGRRKLAENAAACFLAQQYPAMHRTMLIYDDLGQWPHAEEPVEMLCTMGVGHMTVELGKIWLASFNKRCPHLAHKYNLMLQMAGDIGIEWDVAVVWDDDDIYLKEHLSEINTQYDVAISKGLSNPSGAHPTAVGSLYTGSLAVEGASGRFHGALAVSRHWLESNDGWVQTKRETFDQEMLAAVRPYQYIPSCGFTYIFRWNSTNAPHAQHVMGQKDPEKWWDDMKIADPRTHTEFVPTMDEETKKLFSIKP